MIVTRLLQASFQGPFGSIVSSTGRESLTSLLAMEIFVNYTSPWDKRYWAKDYADEALRILVQSGWPEGSLFVEHTDPSSPTHWRVMPTNGIQQLGW